MFLVDTWTAPAHRGPPLESESAMIWYTVPVPGEGGIDEDAASHATGADVVAFGSLFSVRVSGRAASVSFRGRSAAFVFSGSGASALAVTAGATDDGAVHVLVALASHIVRLVVPADVGLWEALGRGRVLDPARFSVCSLSVRPQLVHFADLDTVVVSTANARIVVLDMRAELFDNREFDLAQEEQRSLSSYLATPMKLFGRAATAPNTPSLQPIDPTHAKHIQPIALTSVSYEAGVYVLAYCRDRNVRVYDLVGRKHLKTIPTSSVIATNGGANMSFLLGSSTDSTLSSLLPQKDSLNTFCNAIKVFGLKSLPDPATNGALLSFKLAVLNYATDYDEDFDEMDAAVAFDIFEGEITPFGQFRQIHLIGKKSAPPHIIKDFDFTQSSPRPSSAPRTPSRMPIEDDDVDMGIGGDSEWYQIFCVTTNSRIVVGDVEIGGAEDVSGLRVRSGTAFGERWELISSTTSFSEPTQFSDAKEYADYIFDGGRFSAHTVLCAFENWAGKWWKGAGDVVVREFQSVLGTARSRVVSCVEEVRDVKNAVSTMLERGLDSNSSGGPVDKKQAVLQRWHQLLEYCIELDKTEHAAFGVSTASGLPLGLLISRRGQISALRPVDPIEGLELPNMVLVPTDVLRGHPYLHSISEQRFRAGVENLNNLLNVVNETLSVRERSGFLASVREALKKPVQGSVEASVLRPGFEKWFKESLSGEKRNRIQVGVASVLGGIEEVLQFVANAFGVSGGASQSPGRKGLVDLFKLGSSTVGEQEEWVQSLGVKTFVEVVAARVKVSENILVLLGVLVGLNQGNVGKKEVARWVGLYQNVVVAEWISKTNVITVESKSQTDDMMDLDVEGSSISEKLPLSLFLSRAFSKEGSKGLQIKKPTKTVESKGAVLLEFVYTVFRSLGLFAVAEQTSTQQQLQSAPPLKVSSLLMYSCWALASAGQAKIAVELLGFYPKETNSLQYLDGFAKLKAGDYDAAKVALEKAGNCFIGGLGKLEKEWHLLLEDSVLVGGELGYYRHVIALFEEERVHKVVAHFAKLALGVIPDKEKKLQKELYESLWKTMFSHSLEAKEFESAHGFLKEAEIETQKICIRSFITALCQNHEIDALCCRYVFGKLQSEVEETLIFQAKARKVAPIPSAQKGTPISEPNYHQILYCYYTTRGNNRDAAAIMYDYARRLNSVSSLDIGGGSLVGVITEQSRAYLAAINSLSLVAEDYRWILYKTTLESASHPLAKRRKVGLVTNDSDYGANVTSQARNQEIVDLDEIRKEYTLTMAKLTLAHHYRDLSVSAGLPDPEVAVKLLAENAQFDQAILLAETFEIRLDEIFGRFGAHCVVLMEADINSGIKAPYQPVIDDAPVEWEGTNSDKAWLSLKLRLEQQQRKRKHTTYTLRKAIADRSLVQSSKVDLPDWLINGFKVEKPEDLIHVYLSHNLTKKAAQFAIDFVTQYTNSLPEFGDRIQPSHSVKLLPYSALDQLITTLDEVTAGAANEELKDLRTRLAASLYTYLLRTGEDTINFVGKDSANTAKIAHAIAAQPPQHISKTLRHEGAMGPFANKTLTKDMSGVLSGGGSSSILSRLGPAVQATST